ncbi:HNH endonuclease signature motif containing protein [Bdellovibrio sp. ArHS]|uniref:HNH endonuclease n=1 Tax=Bdellovibrio sp. ArHS TaxID=1569284 RepID=UPI000AE3CA1B|nr:HNH endonuclease signature motif containing protein [Bdellovibrio sp. ArHS]
MSKSTRELDAKIKSLSGNERTLLKIVILTIAEIDGCRSYQEMGYANIFDYLTKEVGYSEGSAQRRIDAARLIREIPEAAELIESGEIKLNQVSMLQKASRELMGERNIKIPASDKKELLTHIMNRSHSETQREIASFFDLPIVQEARSHTQADESVRIEFTLSKRQYEKLKQAQGLLAHSLSTNDIPRFIEAMCDKVISQKTKAGASGEIAANSTEGKVSNEGSTATVAVSSRVRKMMLAKQPCCQFKIPSTGKICGSTWLLQVDHIQPRWSGGDNSMENLQVLCAQHNKLKYRLEAGRRFR